MNYSEKYENMTKEYFNTGRLHATNPDDRTKALQIVLFEIHKKLTIIESFQEEVISELEGFRKTLSEMTSKKKW